MTQRPPQRRPTPRPALQRPSMLDAAAIAPASGTADLDQAGMGELMAQFNSALEDLQNDPSLDRDTRDMLRQQFTQAMQDMQSVEGASAGIPDRAVWMDAIQALQASGGIAEGEVNDLVRQINQALAPLQKRESQLAIEFSRRIQTDGQEKALAWFREESAKTGVDSKDSGGQSAAPSAEVSPLLKSEAVNSRSHRLRGPPGRK